MVPWLMRWVSYTTELPHAEEEITSVPHCSKQEKRTRDPTMQPYAPRTTKLSIDTHILAVLVEFAVSHLSRPGIFDFRMLIALVMLRILPSGGVEARAEVAVRGFLPVDGAATSTTSRVVVMLLVLAGVNVIVALLFIGAFVVLFILISNARAAPT